MSQLLRRCMLLVFQLYIEEVLLTTISSPWSLPLVNSVPHETKNKVQFTGFAIAFEVKAGLNDPLTFLVSSFF